MKPLNGSHDEGLKRDVGFIGLLFTSEGSIIGSGWLFGALFVSTIGGPAAIIAWLIGSAAAVTSSPSMPIWWSWRCGRLIVYYTAIRLRLRDEKVDEYVKEIYPVES